MPKAYYFYTVNYLGCVNPDNDIKFIYYIFTVFCEIFHKIKFASFTHIQ